MKTFPDLSAHWCCIKRPVSRIRTLTLGSMEGPCAILTKQLWALVHESDLQCANFEYEGEGFQLPEHV
jgi:hypothetical protein